MSPWPWALEAILITAALAAAPSKKPVEFGLTPPSAVGPTSTAEAELLTQDGRKDFAEGRFADAARKLQRLLDRYPSSAGAMDARWMLGRAYLKTGAADRAIAPLQAFILARSSKKTGHEARLDLGRAYLQLKKNNEAYLTSLEVLGERSGKNAEIDSNLETAALLLRGEALLGMGREERAAQTLDNARKLITAASPRPGFSTPLRAELERLQNRIQLRVCSHLPVAGALTEAQALDQLGRRGDCLQEAALIARRAYFDAGEVDSLDLINSLRAIREELTRALADYQAACLHPPNPPGKRSARQLKQYQEELSDRLIRTFNQKKARMIDVLRPGVEDRLPSAREGQLNTLIQSLEQVS